MKIWFYPDSPREFHKIRHVTRMLDLEDGDEEDHDLRMWWSYRTTDDRVVLDRTVNGGCADVGKNRVEEVFSDVFGYKSFVDPTKSWSLEKSNLQAKKTFRLCSPPTEPRDGFVYQFLVDTRGFSCHREFVDLRVVVIGNRIPLVIVKEKQHQLKERGVRIHLSAPEIYFTRDELSLILDFCRSFGLDFGEIDIVRSPRRRPYIIDVNNAAADTALRRVLAQEREYGERIYAELFRKSFLTDEWLVR